MLPSGIILTLLKNIATIAAAGNIPVVATVASRSLEHIFRISGIFHKIQGHKHP